VKIPAMIKPHNHQGIGASSRGLLSSKNSGGLAIRVIINTLQKTTANLGTINVGSIFPIYCKI